MELPAITATKVHFPEEDIRDLQGVFGEILRSGQLTLGKHTREFEEAFGPILGVPHAIAVNSGTSALEIILRGLHLRDTEVVIPTNTFAATAFAVTHSGNRLRLSDIGSDLCMSQAALEASTTHRTRAVVLVHIGGFVARDSTRIEEFCRERGIALIEDAAHAHGSSLNNRLAGTFGAAAAFSFYPTKVITSGEGGMVVTSDASLAATARILRDQGKESFTTNLHVEMGYNWRLSEFHAAIGLSQLRRLKTFVAERRAVAEGYNRLLGNLKWIQPLHATPGVHSNYYKYIALLDGSLSRQKLKTTLKTTYKISLGGEVYDVPLHRQPIFEKTGVAAGEEFAVANDLCARHVCLPMSAVMTESEVERVAEGLRQVEPRSL